MSKFISLSNLLRGIVLSLLCVYVVTPVGAVEYGIFGDAIVRDFSEDTPDDDSLTGSLSLFAAHEFTDNIAGLLEFAIEDTAHDTEFDLERYWVGYELDDALTVSVGRFHRPLGYWNRHFHHGRLLHDTVRRPFFIEFEHGGTAAISMHVAGLMAKGEFDHDAGILGYEFTVGTVAGLDSGSAGGGHADSHLEVLELSDLDENKSYGLRVSFTPSEADWNVGVFGLRQTLIELGSSGTGALTTKHGDLVEQTIHGVDARYARNKFDFLAECFHLRHEDKVGSSPEQSADAFYTQFGYRVRPALKVVYRYSSLDFDDQDAYFQLLSIQEQAHHVLTLRYDINEFHTLKFELDELKSTGGGLQDTTIGRIQWAFLLR